MKTWFITGASRGFGALIVEAALATDAVVATARDPSSIADHPRLLKLPLDVTNEAQARDAAARAIEKFGGIDVLVNNAGHGLLGAVEEASAIEVERVFATNVFGLLNVTRAVLPYMRSRGSGHIINMSSIGGYASSWLGRLLRDEVRGGGRQRSAVHRACAARYPRHRRRARIFPHGFSQCPVTQQHRRENRRLCRHRGRDAYLRRGR
jgi:NAD(P)-dependent dehydrogenase (short-subunit alcohol dehydrogenase family)